MKTLLTLFLAIFVSACTTSVIDMTAKPTVQKFDLSDSDNDGVIQARDACHETFAGAKIDSSGCSAEKTNTLRRQLIINFSNDSYLVRSEFLPEVEKLATVMQDFPSVKVTIEGHTSQQGKAEYNKKLSLQRAKAIKNILVTRFAIEQSRITTIGYGFQRLLLEGDDDYINARNRRIVAEMVTDVQLKDLKWTIYSVDDPVK